MNPHKPRGVVGKTELSSFPCSTFEMVKFLVKKTWPIVGHKNHLIKSKGLRNSIEQKIAKLGTYHGNLDWIVYLCAFIRDVHTEGPWLMRLSGKTCIIQI